MRADEFEKASFEEKVERLRANPYVQRAFDTWKRRYDEARQNGPFPAAVLAHALCDCSRTRHPSGQGRPDLMRSDVY